LRICLSRKSSRQAGDGGREGVAAAAVLAESDVEDNSAWVGTAPIWDGERVRAASEREGRQGGWGAEGNVATVMGGAGAASSDGRGDGCVDDGVGAAETVHAWDGERAYGTRACHGGSRGSGMVGTTGGAGRAAEQPARVSCSSVPCSRVSGSRLSGSRASCELCVSGVVRRRKGGFAEPWGGREPASERGQETKWREPASERYRGSWWSCGGGASVCSTAVSRGHEAFCVRLRGGDRMRSLCL